MLAFHLYCQLPYGRMHKGNPEIIVLANFIGRTPSAVAMKLVNFASLDPSITDSGRKGLGNASRADSEIWRAFNADWNGLDAEVRSYSIKLGASKNREEASQNMFSEEPETYVGETKQVTVSIRQRQSFFRRSVLASYEGQCCMSGVSTGELLIASHIVPWAEDEKNRLNPRNGLCLSALHDKAFDRGLITVTPRFEIRVSAKIRDEGSRTKLGKSLSNLDGEKIRLPSRFVPSIEFLQWHNDERFEKPTVGLHDF